MSFTNAAEVLLLNWMFTAEVVSRPTAWAVSLHTGDPGETGLTAEVLVADDADYVRQVVSFDPAAGVVPCLSDIAVAHTPAVGTVAYIVSHITVHATAPGAVALMSGQLQVPKTIDHSNTLSLSIGDIVAAIE